MTRLLDIDWWHYLRDEYPERCAACAGVALAVLGLGGYASVSALGGGGGGVFAGPANSVTNGHPAATVQAGAQLVASPSSTLLASPLFASSSSSAAAAVRPGGIIDLLQATPGGGPSATPTGVGQGPVSAGQHGPQGGTTPAVGSPPPSAPPPVQTSVTSVVGTTVTRTETSPGVTTPTVPTPTVPSPEPTTTEATTTQSDITVPLPVTTVTVPLPGLP